MPGACRTTAVRREGRSGQHPLGQLLQATIHADQGGGFLPGQRHIEAGTDRLIVMATSLVRVVGENRRSDF